MFLVVQMNDNICDKKIIEFLIFITELQNIHRVKFIYDSTYSIDLFHSHVAIE